VYFGSREQEYIVVFSLEQIEKEDEAEIIKRSSDMERNLISI